MNFRQKLSILFYLKRSKKSKDGKITIYVRVTIDGLDDEFSSACKVLDKDWNSGKKQVLPKDPFHKQTNKTLGQIKSDHERHFDLIQAKEGLATPELVIESYKTPLNGKNMKDEKVQNLAFSEKLDALINKHISLSSRHLRKEEDGQIWANIKRQKTRNNEGVPLLPSAIQLIEKYKDHPVAIRRNRLFPVPTNQTFNKELKNIGTIVAFELKLDTHDARRCFANAITFNNGVDLKTIGGYLGQKSIRTTEVYVKNNKRNLSENMKMVKEKLFDKDGKLKPTNPIIETTQQLRVVHISRK